MRQITHSFPFTYKGETFYLVYHPFSNSLHSVDYKAYLVIKNRYEELSPQELADFSALDKAEVSEILSEIEELEAQGLIGKDETFPYRKSSLVKALCLHVCHDCNLKCAYCFAKEGTYNTARDYMTEEVAAKAIDFLIEKSGSRKSLEIDFFGGEPLMNMSVVKFAVEYGRARAKEHGKEFSFTMTTNALLLNDANIEYLNREMDNVVISIDGREEVHNRVRKTRNGTDAYPHILEAAKKFRAVRGDKRYYIRGTFTAFNLDFASDVLALADAGFDQISVEPVVLPADNPMAITADKVGQVLKEYDKLTEAYIDRRANGKWFNFFHFMIDLEEGPCIMKRLSGCSAGCGYLAISPTGDIYPCHQFVGEEGYKIGNVLEGTFDPAIQKQFAEITVNNKAACEDCFAKYYCSGGCVAASHYYEKDLFTPYGAGCEMMKKRLECSLAIYAVEKKNHEKR
ncbi:MAG TPA: thioether cross-link-forming SCIFF peptide maturase [Clostridiales bacterium]|nr:thioether cross-link-forming SCIFF peptide maturase [Clostridiales bacterium]